MTPNQQTVAGSLWLIIVFVGFGIWLGVFSKPSPAEIAAKRQPPAPVPTVTLQQLNQLAVGHEVKGSLPIDLEAAGLGRTDPFAGQ
jgi:hypothetical protein